MYKYSATISENTCLETLTHWIVALLQQRHVLEELVVASCAPRHPLPL